MILESIEVKTQWTFSKEEAEKTIKYILICFELAGEKYPFPSNWESLSLQEKLRYMWKNGDFEELYFYHSLQEIFVEGE